MTTREADRDGRGDFDWTVVSADSCRWEQAFFTDGGRSWETNWIMKFARRR